MRNNKAPGPDAIPAEALKADIETTVDTFHLLFEQIWKEEDIPDDWKESYLIKLPKKGDLSDWGIMLLSVPGKIFNRVLLNRIRDEVDTKLRDEKGKS